MATPVYVKGRQPNNAHLVAWGHHATGWWGCITFRARIEGDGEPELDIAAWVPAHALDRPGWSTPDPNLPRIHLADDRKKWPAPPRWPAWYAGPWPDGALALPPGVVLVTGAAWRKRPPRGPLEGHAH